MKYRRYKIVNFYEEVEDKEFEWAWVVVANTVDMDPRCDAGYPETDLYGKGEFSELFIAPYDSTIIDELEGIAQSGELWSPDMQFWQIDKNTQLIDGIPVISHHYYGWANGKVDRTTRSSHRIVSWKPLKQLIVEQHSELKQSVDNHHFICGSVQGTISPLAAKMLRYENISIADFKVAMVSINGTTPLPFLLPALNPKSKLVKTPKFYVERLLELGMWRDAFVLTKKNIEDSLETLNLFFSKDYDVFDRLNDGEAMIEEERSITYEAFVNHCTAYFLPEISNLLNIFKSAVGEMDNSYLNFEPEIEDIKRTVDSMLEEPLSPPPALPPITL